MSTYDKKATSRKGNNKKKAQAHQNTTAWKHNKNSRKTREIEDLPVYGLCGRCTEVILWRKKYRKYKPLTSVKKCTNCQEKAIKEAYHVLCHNCASAKNVCAKCLESREIVTTKDEIKTAADLQRDEQELEKLLNSMTLRQRRAYVRKMERAEQEGSDVSDSEDMDDLDFSEDDEDDEDEDDDEQEPSKDEVDAKKPEITQ